MPRQQVFISYSHKDSSWREELETHLKPYLRGGSIVSWSDQKISPGSEWVSEIRSALASSKIAVLLVSPDFLASDFIHDHELGPLLMEAKQWRVKILWVPVRDSAYQKTPLKDYQPVLDPSTPLAKMKEADRDSAWVTVCQEIEKAVNRNDSNDPFPGDLLKDAVLQSAPPSPDRPSTSHIQSEFTAIWRHISPTLENDLRESIKLTEAMRAVAEERWHYSLPQPYPQTTVYNPHLFLIRQYNKDLWKWFTKYIDAALSAKQMAHRYNNAFYARLNTEFVGRWWIPPDKLRAELNNSALKLEALADQLNQKRIHYDVVTSRSNR